MLAGRLSSFQAASSLKSAGSAVVYRKDCLQNRNYVDLFPPCFAVEIARSHEMPSYLVKI